MNPTSQPTQQPTHQPTCQPSMQPSFQPSSQPSSKPSSQPTSQAILATFPTTVCAAYNPPTRQPYGRPSSQPTNIPTKQPSSQPTGQPSHQPIGRPTSQPSLQPLSLPTSKPSQKPTVQPSSQPTSIPSSQPTFQPTSCPTGFPSLQPTSSPTAQPTGYPTSNPSSQPSSRPSLQPSRQPSSLPSSQPSVTPSQSPSSIPTMSPSCQPSSQPTMVPSGQPSRLPTSQPSNQPTMVPSAQPICAPTSKPTSQPSSVPSMQPSNQPTGEPTSQPILAPTSSPTSQPTSQPSNPTSQPSSTPSGIPTQLPTGRPSTQPSSRPSQQPSQQPIASPTSSPSSIPTSAPSCGVGYEGTRGSCTPCEPGYYLSDREWDHCRACDMDYFQPNGAQQQCNRCDYPLATTKRASLSCDAWGLMLNVPGLWFVYTVVLGYCLCQFCLLFYTHYNWQVGIFCLLSFGQVCNTLGDVFFFITQRMFVTIFALIVGVVFFKIVFFLWVVQTKIEHPNFFAANHIQKLLTGDQIVFWLRFVNGSIVDVRNRAAALHFLSSGEDAATADRLVRFLLDNIIFALLQLIMVLVFLLWMVFTSFIWFPVLCLGFILMEMKVLCFWWSFRLWNWLWTFRAQVEFKDERLNAWDEAMHEHVSVTMWKYSVVSDGLVQSLPMFALKLTHLLYFPTISLLQRILLIISIGLSGIYCIYGAVLYFEMVQHRRNRRHSDILREQAPTIVNLVEHRTVADPAELLNRVDMLRLRVQNEKASTAELQLFVALQCHTQESNNIMLRVASLGLTSPDKLRHGSVASICEIISHVRHHPLRGEDAATPADHEKLRKTMRSIANCVAIQKSFFYRTSRFYKKRFAQAVNEVRRQYRVEAMTSVSQKLMWYSGVSVLVMFVKIFLLYFVFLLNRLVYSVSSAVRHSRTLRYLFRTFCCCCASCGEELQSFSEYLVNPRAQNFVPPKPHANVSASAARDGIEMTAPEFPVIFPPPPGESDSELTLTGSPADLGLQLPSSGPAAHL